MDRRKLEALSTYVAVLILGILAFLSVLAAADGIFKWDLLPPILDKVAVLVIVSLSIVLGAAVLVSIVLNISIVASKISAIADLLGRHFDG